MNPPAAAPTQRWDAARYARTAGFVPALGQAALDLLAPARGERILDLGCGDGTLTAKIAAAGAAVVGVDASPEFVAAAGARGLDARLGDGQRLAFDGEFDAVFSNAALHWMRDAEAVARGIARALKPGGRFVAEFGGQGNVARVRVALGRALARRGLDAALFDPWYFPSAETYAAGLVRAGLVVRSAVLIARPTPLPGPLTDWLATFAGPFVDAVPEAERAGFRAEVAAGLDELRSPDGGWWVDYVRLRVAAVKPPGGGAR